MCLIINYFFKVIFNLICFIFIDSLGFLQFEKNGLLYYLSWSVYEPPCEFIHLIYFHYIYQVC